MVDIGSLKKIPSLHRCLGSVHCGSPNQNSEFRKITQQPLVDPSDCQRITTTPFPSGLDLGGDRGFWLRLLPAARSSDYAPGASMARTCSPVWCSLALASTSRNATPYSPLGRPRARHAFDGISTAFAPAGFCGVPSLRARSNPPSCRPDIAFLGSFYAWNPRRWALTAAFMVQTAGMACGPCTEPSK